MSPTKVAKKLFMDRKLQNKLAPYLLLPAFKPLKTPLDAHTYEVVIYPYIKHCNLEDLTLKALRQGYINPEYHTRNPCVPPHADGYKMRLLKRFEQCVTIAIKMKDDENGYVDMDIRYFLFHSIHSILALCILFFFCSLMFCVSY